ncbi:MAG TPA: hypothetical protein VF005_02590 [Acidimicrobiales bacterium]
MFAQLPSIELNAVLRRSYIAAAAVGAGGLILAAVLGYPLVGLGLIAGLALGALNSRMARTSMARYAAGAAGPQKSVFMASSLVRLGAITAVAIVVIVVVRQIGWGMVFGLAFFQFVVLASTARTLLKSLRSDA